MHVCQTGLLLIPILTGIFFFKRLLRKIVFTVEVNKNKALSVQQ